MFGKNKKIIDSSEPVKKWVWFAFSVFIFCAVSYAYFVQAAVVNIVTRQDMEADYYELNSEIVHLEAEYIKIKNSITPELAVDLGYITSNNTKFIIKNTKTPALSLITKID
jgi:hypothetical protein